jgi:2'-5' RNA ligase
MRALFTLSGCRANPNTHHMATDEVARLFIGLWPGPSVRARLAACAAEWPGDVAGAVAVPEPRLHMTLHFLGQVPRHRLRLVAEGLVVPMQPFDLVLDRAEVWRNGTAALCPSQLPEELLTLQRALAAALRPLGIEPEARNFRPHVTLARRAGEAGPPPPGLAPVRWWVTGYELVESRMLDTGASYRLVRQYLGAPPPRPRWPDSQAAADLAPGSRGPADSQPGDWSEQLQSGPVPL